MLHGTHSSFGRLTCTSAWQAGVERISHCFDGEHIATTFVHTTLDEWLQADDKRHDAAEAEWADLFDELSADADDELDDEIRSLGETYPYLDDGLWLN